MKIKPRGKGRVVLSQAELQRVERRFYHIAVNAIFRQLRQRVKNELLNLASIFGGDTLQAGGEGQLAKFVFQPSPVRSSPRPESISALRSGRGRCAHEDVREDRLRQRVLYIAVIANSQLTVTWPFLFDTRLRSGIVAVLQVPGLPERRLQQDARINLDTLEVLQVALDDFEALFGIVVAVEIDERVDG